MAADLYRRFMYRCLRKHGDLAVRIFAEAIGMPIRLEDGRSGVIRKVIGLGWRPCVEDQYAVLEITVEIEPTGQ